MVPVITIDGPSGSGKGTISRAVAGHLGFHLLDSGALYRLVALAGRRTGIDLEDAKGLAELAGRLNLRFGSGPQGAEQVLLDGEDVTAAIRSEEAGNDASRVAALAAVRVALLERQRNFARPPGLVADGRDMGTVVFPDATLKVYLAASPEERARRRYKQLMEKGLPANLAGLSHAISERDRRDLMRAVAPLKPSADAVVIDSTGLTIDQVVAQVLQLARHHPGIR